MKTILDLIALLAKVRAIQASPPTTPRAVLDTVRAFLAWLDAQGWSLADLAEVLALADQWWDWLSPQVTPAPPVVVTPPPAVVVPEVPPVEPVAPPPDPPADPPVAVDDLDPATITVLAPCTDAAVLSWPITARITQLAREGHRLTFEHSQAGTWPLAGVPLADDGTEVPIQGNVCLVAQIDGAWYAAGFDWLSEGRTWKDCRNDEFGAEQIRVAPMDASWPGPRSGDRVGLFVTTPSSDRLRVRTVNERSNIKVLIWP